MEVKPRENPQIPQSKHHQPGEVVQDPKAGLDKSRLRTLTRLEIKTELKKTQEL